jgi:hypothetical protein
VICSLEFDDLCQTGAEFRGFTTDHCRSSKADGDDVPAVKFASNYLGMGKKTFGKLTQRAGVCLN